MNISESALLLIVRNIIQSSQLWREHPSESSLIDFRFLIQIFYYGYEIFKSEKLGLDLSKNFTC